VKYKNKKTNGYSSAKEANRAAELQALAHAGVITELEIQPQFPLLPRQDGERAVKYIADFSYIIDGKRVVEDVKSEMTRKLPAYVLKRKMMKYFHGISVVEL
jgi:DNA repair photolyase